MNPGHFIKRAVIFAFLAGPLLSAMPPVTQAQKNKSQITVKIGQPNVWSLAQAHYLLANMRDENRGLKVTMDPGQLNPTASNGARVDILRTLLGAEFQYNGLAGTQNRLLVQKYEAEYARWQIIKNSLDQATNRFVAVNQEIYELKLKQSKLPGDSSEAANLSGLIAQKNIEKQALDDQIKSLTPQLSSAPTLGELNSSAPFTNAPPGVTNIASLDDKLWDKLLSSSSTPRLNASTALDGYIQMQYELIAKQLTLLRDEVGPEQQIIFLEFPSDIYSVPGKDENYLVQMEWEADGYFGDLPEDESGAQINNSRGRSWPDPITLDVIDKYKHLKSAVGDEGSKLVGRILSRNSWPKDDAAKILAYPRWQELNDMGSLLGVTEKQKKQLESFWKEAQKELKDPVEDISILLNDISSLQEKDRERIRLLSEFLEFNKRYPGLWNKGDRRLQAKQGNDCVEAKQDGTRVHMEKIRVIDIIPRQSALNITDEHAKQEGFALTARLLSLFGFGGQVSFERQRTHYEQFLQQEVYASGFGKGLASFGWTFGPLPGTERLAPGSRTTYAILAVPKDALEIDLLISAKAFHRKTSPGDPANVEAARKIFEPQRLRILIPSEATQGFWVDSAVYTPVKKGDRITVLLRGKYFSPLTGILVEGVPLKRAVSLAKNESDSTSLPVAADPFGEYEYLNSNELILSFKMDPNYIGTPTITLVTPEKSGAINNYLLWINNQHKKSSLQELGEKEPMFLDELDVQGVKIVGDIPDDRTQSITALLIGRGFRFSGDIYIDNGKQPLEKDLLNNGTYKLTFLPDDPKKWTITYHYGPEKLTTNFPSSPTIQSIENIQTGKAEGPLCGPQTVAIRGENLLDVNKVSFGDEQWKILRQSDKVILVESPSAMSVNAGKVLVNLKTRWAASNVADFATSGKAIYEYISATTLLPSIQIIKNLTTEKAEGSTLGGEFVAIQGVNLTEPYKVKFGNNEAVIKLIDPQMLLVQAPAGDEGIVLVTIELKGNKKSKTDMNAIYKYIKPEKK